MGATARFAATRAARALVDVGEEAREVPLPALAGTPRAHQLTMPGLRPVLIAESHWASIIRERRKNGSRDVLARCWMVVSVLPFLLAAVVSPRAHEKHVPDTRLAWWNFGWVRELGPALWRTVTVIGIALLVGVSLSLLPLWALLSVLALTPAVLWVTLRWRWDVIEHIRVVSIQSDARTAVEERLVRDIEYVSERCDEVWIVGHSQGGYLAHRVLAERGRGRWLNVKKFTGLASGLRPIRLISMVREHRWGWSGWLMLTGVAMMMAAMVWGYEPGGFANTAGSRLLSQTMLLGLAQPLATLGESEVPTLIFGNALPTQWGMFPLLGAGITLLAAGAWTGRRHRRSMSMIPSIPSRVIWEELTSPNDIVGSMPIPEIPSTVLRRTIPSLRQPVGDHLMGSYLSRRSTFRLEVARWIARPAVRSAKFASLDAVTDDLAHLSERSYRLRLTVQMVFIFLLILVPVATIGRSLLAASAAFIYIAVGVAMSIAILAGIWWYAGATWRISRYLRAVREAEEYLPSRWSTRPAWVTALTGTVALLTVLGSLSTLAYADLVAAVRLVGVAAAMEGSAGALMAAAIPTTAALCLAVAGLRMVRGFLILGGLFVGRSILELGEGGEEWLALGAPGIWMPLLAGLGLLVALIGNVRTSRTATGGE
ncbi:hypothetical protein CQ027_17335 [Microbacterium sp. MYb32]|nr:hypothetical protein CQ027_17335 [Microbacterium sp. MYb32]